MIPEAATMETMLQLESEYLVAYWDQRGIGKSFSKEIDPKTITFAQLRDDLLHFTRELLGKYNKNQAVVIGYSMGATLALMAAAKESWLFSQLFLVGVDIDLQKAGEFTRNFLSTKAKNSGNRRWIRQVNDLGRTPIVNAKAFQKRAKLLTNLGGINTLTSYNQLMISSIKNMFRSRGYRFGDICRCLLTSFRERRMGSPPTR